MKKKRREGGNVVFDNNDNGNVVGVGNIGNNTFKLLNALLVDGLEYNFISIS